MVVIQEVKKGDVLKIRAFGKQIYLKGNYCRLNKAYECQNYFDISDFRYLKKDKIVFTEFEF